MTGMGFRWDRLWDKGEYLCPVCGFPGCFNKDTFDDVGGLLGSGVCPCCSFEPGLSDDPAQSHGCDTVLECILAFREQWLQRGRWWPEDRQMLWRGNKAVNPTPSGWSPDAQLARLFALAPELQG